MKNIVVPLTYEILYEKYGDDKIEIIKQCLSILNRDDSLKKCLSINFDFFLNQNDDNLQLKLIKENFNRTGIKKIEKTYYNINKIQAFYRGQMIDFIRYIIFYCSPLKGLKIKDGEEFNKHFRKSAIIISDILLERVHNQKWSNTSDINQDSINALPAIRKSIEYTNHLDIKSKQHFLLLDRGYSIFVEKFPSEFKEKFFEGFGISLSDFYSIIIAMIEQVLVNQPTYRFN